MEIRAGGIKITCVENDIEIEEGKTYENCQIRLAGVGTISVTITVRHLVSLTTKSGRILKRAGCQFQKLDGATSILLQRYVNNVQQIRKITNA